MILCQSFFPNSIITSLISQKAMIFYACLSVRYNVVVCRCPLVPRVMLSLAIQVGQVDSWPEFRSNGYWLANISKGVISPLRISMAQLQLDVQVDLSQISEAICDACRNYEDTEYVMRWRPTFGLHF